MWTSILKFPNTKSKLKMELIVFPDSLIKWPLVWVLQSDLKHLDQQPLTLGYHKNHCQMMEKMSSWPQGVLGHLQNFENLFFVHRLAQTKFQNKFLCLQSQFLKQDQFKYFQLISYYVCLFLICQKYHCARKIPYRKSFKVHSSGQAGHCA